MKNNKGITLTSLIIYIAVMFVVLAVIMRISTYFSKNMNDAADVTFETEFEKFNLYMLEETNKKGNSVTKVSKDKTEIIFKDGNIFKFVKENEDEIGKIYLNENIKICENVNDCKFEIENKEILRVDITIGEISKIIKYNVTKKVSLVRLPAEYQEVEYIESTGTQYIDTGLTIYDVDEMKTNIEITKINDYTYFLGTRASDNKNGFLCFTPERFYIQYKNSSTTKNTAIKLNTEYEIRSILKENDQQLYINNTLAVLMTEASPMADTNTMYLFSVNNALGGTRYYFSGKTKYVQLLKNGILIRDYIPCYRKSDGEIGMYDLVNGAFYTNSGTGYFLKGDDVICEEENFIVAEEYIINKKEEKKARLPSEYQAVEYIESTGTQYIDTGIKPTSNTSIEIDFQNNNTGSLYLTGSRGSSTMYFVISGSQTNSTVYAYANGVSSGNAATNGTTWNRKTDGECRYRATLSTNNNNATFDITNLTKDKNFHSTFSHTAIPSDAPSIYLFAMKSSNINSGVTRVYSYTIKENNVVKLNFIPCCRIEDDVVGMYDTVTKTFFQNIGTGNFTAGPDVD